MKLTVRVSDGDRWRFGPSAAVPRPGGAVGVGRHQLFTVRQPRNGTKRLGALETRIGRLGPQIPQHHQTRFVTYQ